MDQSELSLKDQETTDNGPVECLGKTFANDEERRTYFLGLLAEKLKDPEFRKIEGFPISEDEDILNLSDPPYYTACPNPFLKDLFPSKNENGYSRLPYTSDVSEGKNDPLYNAHSYHTKVPHKAIMKYVLHYTNPGDVVLDGFSGTGMAGIASQMCGDKKTLIELGFNIEGDSILDSKGEFVSTLGARSSILNDLSPIASFISYNYNNDVNLDKFRTEAEIAFNKVKDEWLWSYSTGHGSGINGEIVYTIWSELHICDNCGAQVPYWNIITDGEGNHVEEKNNCPECGSAFSARNPTRAMETIYDSILGKEISQVKCVPILISYKVGTKRFTKKPDDADIENIEKSSHLTGSSIPTYEMEKGDRWKRDGLGLKGISYTHHFFTPRNYNILSSLYKHSSSDDRRINNFLRIWNTSTISRLHKLNRYIPKHNRHVGPMSGTLYVSPLWVEISPFYFIEDKLKTHKSLCLPKAHSCFVSNGSAAELPINDNSIDYIFTDPPFGANLQYAELNTISEAWIKSITNSMSEAVVNAPRGKDLRSYEGVMTLCFKEYNRVLKPGRWITVEFHNSKNAVWVAIQEALMKSGFIVSDVRVLDKKKGTTKQLSMSNAVKQDLIITAYKPENDFIRRSSIQESSSDSCWEFVRNHLPHLPRFVENINTGEIIIERQPNVLFDRMVAFHVQNEISVPISTQEFYEGLYQRFSERDGMIFTPEEVAEYDVRRAKVSAMQQMEIFVTNEESAITWLKDLLRTKPQKYQDIQPKFLKEISGWNKHETQLELTTLLSENFILYSSTSDPVPSQIHTYLSSNYKDLRNLDKSDAKLKQMAKDRWYVPNPVKAQDLEKVREKSLLKEFEIYKSFTGKKLKEFRLEAIRAGFKRCWQDRDYRTVIAVSEKIPESVLQEDPKLLMWYDTAITRSDDSF